MRISDWSSDVCSSDLRARHRADEAGRHEPGRRARCRPADWCASGAARQEERVHRRHARHRRGDHGCRRDDARRARQQGGGRGAQSAGRSEEHTSELQSLMRISYAVFCLKKKKRKTKIRSKKFKEQEITDTKTKTV